MKTRTFGKWQFYREILERWQTDSGPKIESEEADIDQTEFQLHSARKEQTLLA
jgi:hypothetical protein